MTEFQRRMHKAHTLARLLETSEVAILAVASVWSVQLMWLYFAFNGALPVQFMRALPQAQLPCGGFVLFAATAVHFTAVLRGHAAWRRRMVIAEMLAMIYVMWAMVEMSHFGLDFVFVCMTVPCCVVNYYSLKRP